MTSCGCKSNPAKIIQFPGAKERAKRATKGKACPVAPQEGSPFGESEFDARIAAFRPTAMVVAKRWTPAMIADLAVALLADVNAHAESADLKGILSNYLTGPKAPREVVQTISKQYLEYGIDEAKAFVVALLLEAGMPEAGPVYLRFAEGAAPTAGVPMRSTLPIDVQMDMGTGLIDAVKAHFGDAVIAVAVEPGSELAQSFEPWSVVLFPGPAATMSTMADLANLGAAVTSDGGYVPVAMLDPVRRAIERTTSQARAVDIPPVGGHWEMGKWRIHRYSSSFLVTDLTNAGKRGKTVVQFHVSSWPENNNQYLSALDKTAQAIKADVDLEAMLGLMLTFSPPVEMSKRQARGVDVDAPSTPGIKLVGADGTYVAASPTDFVFRGTDVNEMRLIPRRGAKRDIRKVYEWVRSNATRIPTMTFEQMNHELNVAGIKTHSYCAMD